MFIIFIILKILLFILLIIAILLLMVLLIPFTYFSCGRRLDDLECNGSIKWLFGALGINYKYDSNGLSAYINIFSISKHIAIKSMAAKGTSIKINESQKSKSDSKRMVISADLIKSMLHYAKKALKYLKPRAFEVRLRYGFEDPSLTGMACAAAGILTSAAAQYDIVLHPVFDDEVLEGSFLIGGRVQIIRLVVIGLECLFSKPFRNIYINKIKQKIRGGN